MRDIFQIDWRIFIEGASAWLQGRNPYAALSAEFGAGAFAYPPTAFPWLILFVPLGMLGYYLWTALTLGGWWWLARDRRAAHTQLLVWAPVLLHLVEGQSTLPVVLVIWAAFQARRRGWLWGLALAWAMTKPQVAIVPVLWLLWQDRTSALRWRLIGGLALGTLALALPATLLHPGIWRDWLIGMSEYRHRLVQQAAWEWPGTLLFAAAALLWYRSGLGGWHWWLAAALFPQTSFYALVPLIPVLSPPRSYWTVLGLALAMIFMIVPLFPLPIVLSLQLIAAWMIAGGPQRLRIRVRRATIRPAEQA